MIELNRIYHESNAETLRRIADNSVDAECKNCGNPFKIKEGRKKFGRGVYCSKKCQYEGRKVLKEKRVCPVCGNTFEIERCIEKRFCSPKCSYKARGIGLVKRIVVVPYNISREISEWRKLKCKVCGCDFIAKKRNQNHCSRKCFEITHKSTMRGENNPSFKNGESYKKRGYRGVNWNEIRLSIYKRDDYKCQKCGIKCESKRQHSASDNIIQCHHIKTFDGFNNNPENLITLCLKCHLNEHGRNN